jgi:hypothetical protein
LASSSSVIEVFAFNASAQAVMPALFFSPNILLSEASSLDNHRGAVWEFSPDGPARAHARPVAMPRGTPGKPVGSVGSFPLPVSST